MEKKILYLECNTGISGDMAVAALIDLGADKEVLKNVLASIPVSGFKIRISRVKKAGLDVCDFDVVLDEAHENHDHDMEYLYGHLGAEHSHDDHEHSHDGHEHSHDDHEHSHDGHEHSHDGHEHSHDGHEHSHHVHRGMNEVREIIQSTRMTDGARAMALRIFEILGEAEAKAHGTSLEEVHFHEVGAIDSIVDVIAVAVCVDNLGITDCVIPCLHEGTGTVRCAHGILPVPVPAVANIVSAAQLPISITDRKGELITPTGAAVAAALCTSTKLPESFIVKALGQGAGKREYEIPSILRGMIIEQKETEDLIYKLETNIDDATGENLGYVMEKLMEAGARDVNFFPVFMKKNRPAYQLNVVCMKEDVKTLEQIIFAETTTIGIRRQKMERSVLERKLMKVRTCYGDAVVKVCELENGRRFYPEYESVKKLCKENNLSFQEAFDMIKKACE